jgi:hypothetical protein
VVGGGWRVAGGGWRVAGVFSFQFSVFSFQFSVFSFQFSVFSFQFSDQVAGIGFLRAGVFVRECRGALRSFASERTQNIKKRPPFPKTGDRTRVGLWMS